MVNSCLKKINILINIIIYSYIFLFQVYPNQPIQGKDNIVFSTQLAEGDEATVPLSSFQGAIKDMTKAQIKFKLINAKSDENEKEFLLMTDDLNTNKEFVLGSSGDVKV